MWEAPKYHLNANQISIVFLNSKLSVFLEVMISEEKNSYFENGYTQVQGNIKKSCLVIDSKNNIIYGVFFTTNQSCQNFLIEVSTPHCRNCFSWVENARICSPLNFQSDPFSGSPDTSNVPSTVNQTVYIIIAIRTFQKFIQLTKENYDNIHNYLNKCLTKFCAIASN